MNTTGTDMVALLKHGGDENLELLLTAGIPGLMTIPVGPSPQEALARLAGCGRVPALVVISGSLYPRPHPDLAAGVRRLFPGAECLVLDGSPEPDIDLTPLMSDGIRHLVIGSSAITGPLHGRKPERFALALLRLASGCGWSIADCLHPGTPVRELAVRSSAQKEELIGLALEQVPGNEPEHELFRHKVALLADEMLENALYGAPQKADGSQLYRKGENRPVLSMERITFRFGFDGETLAMETTDSWGTLRPEKVMQHLVNNQQGSLDPEAPGGRGIFIIWRFLEHLHICIRPGRQTAIGGHIRLSSGAGPETPKGFSICSLKKTA